MLTLLCGFYPILFYFVAYVIPALVIKKLLWVGSYALSTFPIFFNFLKLTLWVIIDKYIFLKYIP